MHIPYNKVESRFSPLLVEKLNALRVSRNVTINLSEEKGYPAKLQITLVSTNQVTFETNFTQKDPTRFPARIKAVATELRNQGIFGSFLVSHKDGIIEIARTVNHPSFYWVNLGDSHKVVLENNFLWAPSHALNPKGKVTINAGWKSVPGVKKGDVIFCHRKNEIIFVAVASKGSYKSNKPQFTEFERWPEDGYKIEVSLNRLKHPLSTNLFKDEFIELHNSNCNPILFASDGNAAQQYMISLPAVGGSMIMDALGEHAIEIQDTVYEAKADEKKAEGAEREAITKARVGQGKFREEVLKLWNHQCPITCVNRPELLVASHIVSWQLSNSSEKVDPYNGLPLSPNIDKLFDKGYISFSDDGRIVTQKTFDKSLFHKLGINIESSIVGLTNKHKIYLARHREMHHINS
ncbi:MAG: HNH endonuclease [Coraliomargaritaceae bacterium]